MRRFVDVDRRLPGGGAARPEELALQPVGAVEHLAGFRPHQARGIAVRHAGQLPEMTVTEIALTLCAAE